MAHKLAVLVYRMLKFGHEYVDKGCSTTRLGIASNKFGF